MCGEEGMVESGEAAFACLVEQSFLGAHGIYKHLPSPLLLIQSRGQTRERVALFILAETKTWRGLVALPESTRLHQCRWQKTMA